MKRQRTLPAVAALALTLLGCERAELSGPPELRLGRDECAECGMLINEDRCSSASLVERDGVREYAHFDDIGCMLDYQHAHAADLRFLESFVHDHTTRAWCPTTTAVFLVAEREKISTPMGSGIVAFADTAAAAKARDELGARIVDQDALRALRRAWVEERRSAPAGEGGR
jgi:nitrous oxide reductase accessory protein NosL